MLSEKTVVSAQDVAERAGVSRSAVSRVFTPGASVSSAMRARVMKAAQELGYHVNHLARGLVRNRSGIVCLVVSEIATPYRASLVRWLTQCLQEAGKIAMLINTDRSDNSVSAALQQAINFRADASIILSGMPDRTITRQCYQHGQRIILINRDEALPGSLSINLDAQRAAATAVMAFQRAGCQHLAFANSLAGTPSLMKREAAFIAEAQRVGMSVTVERFGTTSYESGQILAHRLLTQHQRPDAVFCVTDLVACGFMDEARHRFALRVPEDLCLIGYDNIAQAGWSSYNLTTFTQPVEQFARDAVNWLIQTESDETHLPPQTEQQHDSLMYQADVVWRGSVRGA
ncbi:MULTISPECIES: substrate-binding domain-containing protein [unclassified Pantoea]|uniref:LacI family DNA-binding transcriptional regulator n=1 Tax=unclassified Pantoea TaxID=2630326 RepID=UPI001CD36F96|nr:MULTISPECIES: substrate-binding domain-containing protein [unclassified Pantoea]MCA1177263.1 substrate-binding domain-containing protein [Pantoea sp. alder69]MCA1253547.1 substrate-binding domain-containing protein [Pantoea sp. alder70]MCA1265752.1 substrate-binding domain-containing protein [Pantoea sp. alder81]